MADKVLNMELPQELYDKAKREADKMTLSVSAFIRQLIINYPEKKE